MTTTTTTLSRQVQTFAEQAELVDPLETMRNELADLENTVVNGFSLSDAIRHGVGYTKPSVGGYAGPGGGACAISAALLSAESRGLLPS